LARTLAATPPILHPDTGQNGLDGLLELSKAHGVHSLLYSRLSEAGQPCPDPLRQAAFHQAALFRLQDMELERLCTGLHQANVAYLLVKGAALAYQIYPTPEVRPRDDTDLFIDRSSLTKLKEVLSSLGYEPIIAHDGGLVSYQTGMAYADECRVTHTVDIHWNLSNRHEFQDILAFQFIRESAVSVPRFSFPVYAPNQIHALCLACLHLVGHHADSPRLIWLYDMQLLLQRMQEQEIDEFVELTRSRALGDVTCRALTEVSRHFDDKTALNIMTRLGHGEGLPMPEESRLALLMSNIHSFPTLSAKYKYLLALAFPSQEYIRNQYQPRSRLLIPWYYLYRIFNGALKTLDSGIRRKTRR
jgi:hypothetical protein